MWDLAYGPLAPQNQTSLEWLQAHHPEWILYECDRKTVKYWEKGEVQIDVSQPAVVEWQLGMLAGESSPRFKLGYNAIAVDNFMVGNTGVGACGHFAPNGSWVQQYTGAAWDPAWRSDMLGWLQRFYAGLQATPAYARPLLILNTDLSYTCQGGCLWNDSSVLFIGNHSDGVLNEGALTWDEDGHGQLPENLDAAMWTNEIKWAANLQRAGKGYYADVESMNATASPQSVKKEFNAVSAAYWSWWLASYLLGKGNASGLYVTPMLLHGAEGDQYTYGRAPWFHDRYRAASAIGAPAAEIRWIDSNCSGPSGLNSSVNLAANGNFAIANASDAGLASDWTPLATGYRRETSITRSGDQSAIEVVSAVSDQQAGAVYQWNVATSDDGSKFSTHAQSSC